MRFTEIFFNGMWKDVTRMKAIAFGVGDLFVAWWNNIQLPDIAFLVDSDTKKQGRIIQIGGKVYEILSPNILSQLSSDNYYVVLPGNRFINERQKNIANICSTTGMPFICGPVIRYVYDNLQEMLLCDPIIRRKVKEQNCSLLLAKYIKKFSRVVKINLGDIKLEKFIPVVRGHKVIFEFDGDGVKYICNIHGPHCLNPADMYDWRISSENKHNRKEIDRVKEKLNINKNIDIYNEEDFLIQYYGNVDIDFTRDDIKKKVLEKIHLLHNCGEKIPVVVDVTNRCAYEFQQIPSEIKHGLLVEVERHISGVVLYLKKNNYENVICHGDFHQGNIIELNGDLHFIDWDFMCMANPLYDVCRFLYYSSIDEKSTDVLKYIMDMEKLNEYLSKYLAMYYGRVASRFELLQATAMLLLCEWIEMCLRIQRNQSGTDLCLEHVLNHIKKWEEMV